MRLCSCGAPMTHSHGAWICNRHCDRTDHGPCHAGVCDCCRRYAHRLTARIAATTPVKPT